MQEPERHIMEIVEGTTKILVPEESLTERVPPTEPAFFNPRARANRDLSMVAYAAFVRRFDGPRILVDCMSGLGAMGLRAANELGIDRVIINDLNPRALEIARRSITLNGLDNVEVTRKEACAMLCGDFSGRNCRASMVDIDPFGSPARFIDCGIRATMHGGILAVTATDLQVLNGLFPSACRHRYGGVPARVEYGKEVAVRLILGCIRHIAARMNIKVVPLMVQSNMHYYRVFVRVLNRPDQEESLGYIVHCSSCGNREQAAGLTDACRLCGAAVALSGPLWTGRLFERQFVADMVEEADRLNVHGQCKKMLAAALLESEMPAAYYTLDDIASRAGTSPVKLGRAVEALAGMGFRASPTSFDPTGFRTDAPVDEIKRVFGG